MRPRGGHQRAGGRFAGRGEAEAGAAGGARVSPSERTGYDRPVLKSTRRGAVDVAELTADDPRVLHPNEVVFVVVRGRSTSADFLVGPETVFGRNEVRFQRVTIRVTDYLGYTCLHTGRPVDDPADMVLGIRDLALVAVLRETSFKPWFVLQDKGGLGRYRFAAMKDGHLVAGDQVTRIHVRGEKPATEVAYTSLVPLEYGQLADASADAEAASVRGRAKASGEGAAAPAPGAVADDLNLVFCPRCDHPNKLPFLEMVGSVHACERCQGGFTVKVMPVG